MIKGTQKRAVVIKGSPESLFESAYFILKRERDGCGERQIIYEANRLISERTFKTRAKISKKVWLLLLCIFLVGLALGVALGLLLSILFY